MNSIFPIIPVSALQRNTKEVIESVDDYAVIRRHNEDVGFLLHPAYGHALVESGLLRELVAKVKEMSSEKKIVDMKKLDSLIGNVLQELSKE